MSPDHPNHVNGRFVITAATALFAGLSQVAAQTAMAQAPDDAPRQIALTFDDAPRGDGSLLSGAMRTDALIAALDRAEVEGAMFFVVTGQIGADAERRERIEAYGRAGHAIANHSHTHPHLRDMAAADFLADVDRAEPILAAFGQVSPFFRYPFLDEGDTAEKREEVAQGLAERGLRNGYVTVDNYDWYMQALVDEAVRSGHSIDTNVLAETYVDVLVDAVAFYDAIAQEALGRSPRHVLLLHENDLAALFVDDLVAALRAGGWQIIAAEAAFADEIATTVPDTEFNGQGRVAALAHAAGMTPRDLVHPMEDEAMLRALFEDRGLIPVAE